MKTKLNLALFYLLVLFFTFTNTQAVEILPANLTSFTSNDGQRYLRESFDNHTLKLLSHFTTQKTTTYCGVASVVMVLNSSNLPKPSDTEHPISPDQPNTYFTYFTQEDFFTDRVKAIIPPETVLKQGITLNQLNQITQSFGLKTELYYADRLKLNSFRNVLRRSLAKHKFVIVNFLRSGLKQVGGGHHSPLATYDRKSDRFLVLDVARYKYPAYWVKTEDLWNATNTRDADANASRGFIVIHP